MKVLVVEAYSHLKVLENVYNLLKDHCKVSFYLNRSPLPKLMSLFPSAKESTLIVNKFHSSIFFIWLLFFARRFNYINISTGPEGDHFSEIFNILCFYLCCVIYRKKIILTVKNICPYLKSTGGLFAYLRNRSINKLKYFTFETKTMKDTFEKYAGIKNCLLGVSYDRYTDLFDLKLRQIETRADVGMIRVGLLGMIAPDRRDYGLIAAALEGMSADERSKIEMVVLGMCPGGINNDVIKVLEKYVKVDCWDGVLSAEEFDSRGFSCNILISPLIVHKGYGTFKGSGSLGDALYLKKRIVLPSHVDPEEEFKEIAIYYQNIQELSEIFRSIQQLSKDQVDPAYYEKFSTQSVFNYLVKDLRLCG